MILKTKSKKGVFLLEVVIASSIVTIGLLALISSYLIYMNYAFANQGNVQASYLEEEGIEVMSYFRDKGWTKNIFPLSTTTTYYLNFSTDWATTTTAQYVDTNFLREVAVGDVQRDVSGKIVASLGTYDPNTKLITVTLKYFQGHGTTTRSISSYITNINQD